MGELLLLFLSLRIPLYFIYLVFGFFFQYFIKYKQICIYLWNISPSYYTNGSILFCPTSVHRNYPHFYLPLNRTALWLGYNWFKEPSTDGSSFQSFAIINNPTMNEYKHICMCVCVCVCVHAHARTLGQSFLGSYQEHLFSNFEIFANLINDRWYFSINLSLWLWMGIIS